MSQFTATGIHSSRGFNTLIIPPGTPQVQKGACNPMNDILYHLTDSSLPADHWLAMNLGLGTSNSVL